jgi:hypothetical protein
VATSDFPAEAGHVSWLVVAMIGEEAVHLLSVVPGCAAWPGVPLNKD